MYYYGGDIKMKLFKHFITITRHRHMVMRYCFRVGLFRQGLMHDLSKYSLIELINGAKYYMGNKSPHYAERKDKGYSDAWMHHKGRNKHHGEYWTDYNEALGAYAPVPMPRKYVAEMFCDRIAASKIYYKKNFTKEIPLNYYLKGKTILHDETRKDIEFLLRMYKDEGEKHTLKYIKKKYLKGK